MPLTHAPASLAAALLLGALSTPLAAAEWPAPVRALESRGLRIVGKLDAPGGLSGYAALMDREPISIFVTPDGKHAVIGPMVDAKGANVSERALDRVATAPLGEQAWKRLESSSWIRDGRAEAPRVVYVFTDPNCPYCSRFWNDARPWVDAGKVQLRHLMLGMLAESSAGKAAAILSAKDPQAELARSERDRAGFKPIAVDAAARRKLDDNQKLLLELGSPATPTIFYRDAGNVVRKVQGAPSPDALALIMGPR